MYLSEILAAIRRRRWIVLLGVLLTVGGSAYLFTVVPPQQVSKASVLLLPPKTVVTDSGNPFLALGGLQPVADVLARALNDGPTHTDLAPEGGPGDFVVSRDTTSSGPMLIVEVTTDDADASTAMLDAVLTTMPDVLDQLQSSVDAQSDAFIRMTVVARDATPTISYKPLVRALIVAVVGGLALTAAVTFAVDGLLVRRALERRLRAERAQSEPGLGATRTSRNDVPHPTMPTPSANGARSARRSGRGDASPGPVPAEPDQVPASSGAAGRTTSTT